MKKAASLNLDRTFRSHKAFLDRKRKKVVHYHPARFLRGKFTGANTSYRLGIYCGRQKHRGKSCHTQSIYRSSRCCIFPCTQTSYTTKMCARNKAERNSDLAQSWGTKGPKRFSTSSEVAEPHPHPIHYTTSQERRIKSHWTLACQGIKALLFLLPGIGCM